MNNKLMVKTVLIDDYMKFKGGAKGKDEILTNYHISKMPKEHTPLELFLISLANCYGGTLSGILLKNMVEVSNLSIEAVGIRKKIHPTCFEKIKLNIYITSNDIGKLNLDKILKSVESICPVVSMIKNEVLIEKEVIL
ncbi:MAG: OsmC family protein [Clostridiales bacterium]